MGGDGLTAWRSCSASFCLPPGSLKVDISITEISAHGKSTFVLAGRFHGGSGVGSGEITEVMMN